MSANKMVYFFGVGKADGGAGNKHLLGAKGAALAEMAHMDVPVPPGFTITTEVCTRFHAAGGQWPAGLTVATREAMIRLEKLHSRGFGSTDDPLLVSVRPGARQPIPGLADSILNLGLNADTVAALGRNTGNERFAFDTYRRFIQMYGTAVLGMNPADFEAVIASVKVRSGARDDVSLDLLAQQVIVREYKVLVEKVTGKPFPDDPWVQLTGAINAAFASWNSPKAVEARRADGIPADWGTAVTVQAMVFGNLGDDSATGVAVTRDPATGDDRIVGQYLLNAQGEDVTAGIRPPQFITEDHRERTASSLPSLETAMPDLHAQLVSLIRRLEQHFGHPQEVAFTVERKRLFMLESRSVKRSTAIALRWAVDMHRDGVLSKDDAVRIVSPEDISALTPEGQLAVETTFDSYMDLVEDVRSLAVRTQADTAEQALLARATGAAGIGLWRVEPMFSAPDRIDTTRELILGFHDAGRRTQALDKLRPLFRADLVALFRAVDGLPVAIRILGAPLHSFLPDPQAQAEEAIRLKSEGADAQTLARAQALRRAADSLREVNPMLGHRGARLAITAPDLFEMQVRAVAEAACEAKIMGLIAAPEILIPRIATGAEMSTLRSTALKIVASVCADAGVAATVKVGAVFDLPRACLAASEIAPHADVVSFDTDDLTQITFGLSRDDLSRFFSAYLGVQTETTVTKLPHRLLDRDPFTTLDRKGVGALLKLAVDQLRAARPGLPVGAFGPHGADPSSIGLCHDLGLSHVTCPPDRVTATRVAAAHAAAWARKLAPPAPPAVTPAAPAVAAAVASPASAAPPQVAKPLKAAEVPAPAPKADSPRLTVVEKPAPARAKAPAEAQVKAPARVKDPARVKAPAKAPTKAKAPASVPARTAPKAPVVAPPVRPVSITSKKGAVSGGRPGSTAAQQLPKAAHSVGRAKAAKPVAKVVPKSSKPAAPSPKPAAKPMARAAAKAATKPAPKAAKVVKPAPKVAARSVAKPEARPVKAAAKSSGAAKAKPAKGKKK